MTINYNKAAIALTGSSPLKVRPCDDGSLVVIASNGQKFRFTAAEVRSVVEVKPAKQGRPTKPSIASQKLSKTDEKTSLSNNKER